MVTQIPEDWRLRRSDVRRAVAATSRSAPGPDGVPYAAWRRLGPLAVDILHAAGLELSSTRGVDAMLAEFPLDALGNTPFTVATMVFIPKKIDREVNRVLCCEPGDVRPLSIVNTGDRLLASSV